MSNKKILQSEDDCNCGKPLKQNDERRKNAGIKKNINKKTLK